MKLSFAPRENKMEFSYTLLKCKIVITRQRVHSKSLQISTIQHKFCTDLEISTQNTIVYTVCNAILMIGEILHKHIIKTNN